MKIAIIIVTLALAMVSEAQLIYDSIRIKVAPGTSCPTGWTAETSTVVVEAEYHIHTPMILGGLNFLVSENLVNVLWPSDAQKAAAVVSGVLDIQAEFAATKNFCSLLP